MVDLVQTVGDRGIATVDLTKCCRPQNKGNCSSETRRLLRFMDFRENGYYIHVPLFTDLFWNIGVALQGPLTVFMCCRPTITLIADVVPQRLEEF